jgi:hypothetical protein
VKDAEYAELLEGAMFVVDQLKREGDAFKIVTTLRFQCLYVVASSSGVLHRHNTGDSFLRLLYDEPVEPDEFQMFQQRFATSSQKQTETKGKTEGKMEGGGKTKGATATVTVPLPTVLVAWDVIERHEKGTLGEFFKQKAQDFYTNLQQDSNRDKLLIHFVTLIVSSETEHTLEGVIWEQVMDFNYFGEVRFYFDVYRDQLKILVMGEPRAFEGLLRTLLCSTDTVDLVHNGAIGVHAEAALDLGWMHHRFLGWSQSYPMRSKYKGKRQSVAVRFEFGEECMIAFDGVCPAVEVFADLRSGKIRTLYFKPTVTKYLGFDMFVVLWVSPVVMCIHAIQVTVSNSCDRPVGRFFDNEQKKDYVGTWEARIRGDTTEKIRVQCQFHILKPEVDGARLPAGTPTSYKDYFDQISFCNLLDGNSGGISNSGNRCVSASCGVVTVMSDACTDALKQKRDKAKLKKKSKQSTKQRFCCNGTIDRVQHITAHHRKAQESTGKHRKARTSPLP